MSMNFKKLHLKEMTYEPKNANKHKHDYSIKFVLEITNKNIHAAANYYNKKEYYNVLKCTMCDSFIPNSYDGNYQGHTNDYDKELPLITAKTNMKSPVYSFDNLFDVVILKNKE